MHKKTIVVFTSKNDPHVDELSRCLRDYEVSLGIVFADSFNENNFLSRSIGNKGISTTIFVNDDEIGIDEILSAWYRKPSSWSLDTNRVYNQRVFNSINTIRNESVELIRHIFQSISIKKFTFNDLAKMRVASKKIKQLELAKKHGFIVPDSLISSNKSELLDFIKSHNDFAITKRVSDPPAYFVVDRDPDYTYPIDSYKLTEFFKCTENPGVIFLQELIHKMFDIRITVVGNDVFAASIDSQAREETKYDCRQGMMNELKHEAITLPSEIVNKCLSLTRSYGLYFSTIDMAIDKSGKYVFFELNPNGQYLWIEKLTGLPITKAIAHSLMNPTQSSKIISD